MGKGGILQLISYGNQDKILVENPQITLFKIVYKKPTLFSIEQVERPLTLSGESITKNIIIPNYGDLLKSLDLKFELPSIQFEYKDNFFNIVRTHLDNKKYSGNFEAFNYNIDKLEVLELILYNYIIYVSRLPTTSETIKYSLLNEINSLHKTLNGSIALQTDKFDLVYNEIDLEDILVNNGSNLSTNFSSTEYINSDVVLNNVINEVNNSTLLTAEQLKSLNVNLDKTKITSLPGNNILNYSFQFINKIKLQMIDIMMQNYDTYISFVNIITYYDSYLSNTQTEKQILLFNDFFNNFIKNLSYSIIQSDELYSYNTIVNSAPSDILTLDLSNNNTYLINTNAIYYIYPLIIIVDNNYSSIDSLNIKSILQVIKTTIASNNTSMLIYSMLFNSQYERIDNTCFITCSDTPDSLINYSTYYQIYNVSSIDSPLEMSLNNNIYIFQIKGIHTDKFIKNKLSIIFDAKLSTSPYDYIYNTINNDKFYIPLAVFIITSSSYDATNNITTINTSKLSLSQSFSTSDNIFIKNNIALKINDIIVSSTNTDVVTNYNSYITTLNKIGLSDSDVLTNVINVSTGPIKYNVEYLTNIYNNIFRATNYFFHIIEVGYNSSTNTFTTYQEYQNTYLQTILDYLLNILLSTTYSGSFLYRDPNDTLFNSYYNTIKTTLYKLTQDYNSLVYNYNFNLFNYSNDRKQQLFTLISKYTIDSTLIDYEPTYSQELSNIYLNKSIGLGNEYCIIKSDVELLENYLLDIKTNKFSLNFYVNDNNLNQPVNYSKIDLIRNINFTNITFFMVRNSNIIIVDNCVDVYVINKSAVRTVLTDKNFKDLHLLETCIPWSPIKSSFDCSFRNIISYNFFHKKYFVDIVTQDIIRIFYKTELNNIIQLEQNSLFRPYNICQIENKWLTNSVIPSINDNKLYYVSGLTTNNTVGSNKYLYNSFVKIDDINNNNINLFAASISKTINYPKISNIYYFDGFIISIDITNYTIYIFNETTFQTDLIDISFLLYGTGRANVNLYEIETLNKSNFDIVNVTFRNNLFYLYIYKPSDNKYYFPIFNLTVSSTANNMIDSTIVYNFIGSTLLPVSIDPVYFDMPKKVEFILSGGLYNYMYIYNSRIRVYNGNVLLDKTRKFEDSVKYVVWNSKYVVIYFNNTNILQIYNLTDFFSNNDSITTLKIDSTFNNWMIGGITYMWIDITANNSGNLYVGSNNNVYKIEIYNDNSEIKYEYINSINIDKSNGQVLNGSVNGSLIYILTTTQLLKYSYDELAFKNNNVLPNKFYYSYDNVDVIFNNYNNKFTITDKIQNRIIYGDYKLQNDNLVFTNINSANIILPFSTINFIKYIQNNLNGSDYSQTIFIFIENYFNRLVLTSTAKGEFYINYNPFDASSYLTSSNCGFVNFMYSKDTFTFLKYDLSSNELSFNKIHDTIDNITDLNTSTQYTINNIAFDSNYRYEICSDDNYDYLIIRYFIDTKVYRLEENPIDSGLYDANLYIGKDPAGNYVDAYGPYTIPTNSKNVYLDKIKSVNILQYDDMVIHNDNDVYYVNNNNIIKLNMNFGYSGYEPTIPSVIPSYIPEYNANSSPGNSLWYGPPEFLSNQSYNIISQCNYYNHLYFLTLPKNGVIGPSDYTINYIDTITNSFLQTEISGLNGLTGPISIYTLRTIGLNDWLVFSNKSNVYLYQYDDETTVYIYRSTIQFSTNVRSVMFCKRNYILDPYSASLQFDNKFNYLMYILTQNNTTYDGNDVIRVYYLHSDGIATSLNNSYIKPYFISSTVSGSGSGSGNIYNKSPDINHPYLFYIDNMDIETDDTLPTYNEYLIGREQSQINIINLNRIDFLPNTPSTPYSYTSPGPTGPNNLFLYEMEYEYIIGSTDYTFPKYINALIDQPKSNNNPSLYFSYNDDPSYNIKLLFKYNIRNGYYNPAVGKTVSVSGPILYTYNFQTTWINNFNLDIGLYESFSEEIDVYEISHLNHILDADITKYRVDGTYYFSEHPKNRYILEQHELYYTTLYQLNGYNYIYINNKIEYITQFTYNATDYYPSYNNILINLDNKDYLNPTLYSQLQNTVNNVNCKIDIEQIIGPISIITRNKQYLDIVLDSTALDTVLTNKNFMDGYYNVTYATKIFYKISAIDDIATTPYNIELNTGLYSWNLSDYLYIKYKNEYLVGRYGVLASQPYLIVHYKVQAHMNWLDNAPYNLPKGNLVFQDLYITDVVPYNSLTKLQTTLFELKDVNTFINPNQLVQTNYNFYNANIILLDYINWIAYTMTDENSSNLSYSSYRNDLYNIINDILVSTSNLTLKNDDTIVTTDPNGIIYKKIQDNNQASSLYLKISTNFDNFVGYKAVNNKVSKSVIRYYLRDYYTSINILFQNYNDYIVNLLKTISKRPPTSDFLDWTSIEIYEIEDTIKFLYSYVKNMILLSSSSNNYLLFTSQNDLDSVTYLYDNIVNFRDIYNEVSLKYYLSGWSIIEKCIITLYYGINYINNVLNNNNVIVNSVNRTLIVKNSFKTVASDSIIYLEELTDSTVLSYFDGVLDNIYDNYAFNDILALQQNIIDIYFKNIDTLFNNNTIGLTTYTNINNVSLNYDLDINDIVTNQNTVPNNDFNPFILPFSYDIYNIDSITSYLNSNKTLYNTQISYYNDNRNILNLSKLTYDNINNKYIEYLNLKNNSPIKCSGIVGSTGSTGSYDLLVNAIYDVKINDMVGFYSEDETFNVYKVTGINYGTNAINYPPPPPYSGPLPVYIPVTITINADTDQTISLTNNRIYYGIDIFRLANYTPSLYSSINIRNVICYIIFNNFSQIDNIFYDDYRPDLWANGQYNYWYYYDSDYNIKYFVPCPNKQAFQGAFTNYEVDYSKYILSLMNVGYKISDISILTNVFAKTFQINNELNTVDNIIYKFSQIINSHNNVNRDYYSYIFFIHSITHFIDNYNSSYNNLININNINILINKFNTPNPDDINSMLKLISQTTNPELYKYNVYPINLYSLAYSTFTYNSIMHNNMVLSNDLIHSFVYPYNNFNTQNSFNIDCALKNKCITVHIKFTDINTNILNMSKHYSDVNLMVQSFIDIMFYDNFTKDIAINKMKSITILDNSEKFDIYNGISLTDPMIEPCIDIGSNPYDFNKNTAYNDLNLYYRNVVIDSNERINYTRLKIQQLLIWYLATIIKVNDPLQSNYYRKLPENMMYNYDTDNIDTLNTSQKKSVSDFVLYLCDTYDTTFMGHTGHTGHTTYTSLQNIIDNITPSYYDDYETSNITNINNIIMYMNVHNLDDISNMVLPCNYYYIAYIMLKFINLKDINTSNKFIYTNESLKCNYTNYQIKNYSLKQIEFMITQYYKSSFVLEDWIGQIDGVNKIFLCNHFLLYKYVNNINNSTLNNLNFTNCLSSSSNMSSNIKLINYLLMVLFNSNGNHVETHYMKNDILTMKYPTLYLTNGLLVRTTNLPNYYYYDINNMNGTDYLIIKQVELILKNTQSDRNIYNVVNTSINKTINYITSNIKGYFNTLSVSGSDFINTNKYYINVETDIPSLYIEDAASNNFMKYTYNVTYHGVYFQTTMDITHPIIINTYIYVIDGNSKVYYCFITSVTNNKIYINKNLSDNLATIVGSITLFGGLCNMIDHIYKNRQNQYISASNILDRYNEYDMLSEKIIDYMSGYYGNRYTSNITNDEYSILMNDVYFDNLIKDIILDHKNIHIDGNVELSNYILPTDLFNIEPPYDFDINETLTLYKKIVSMLSQNKVDYNNILKENNKGIVGSPSMSYVLNAISSPYNIYSPMPPKGNWIKYLGHYILDYIEFFIGDESIQKITDDYLHIAYGLNTYIQKVPKYLQNIGYTSNLLSPSTKIEGQTIYLPIPWTFNSSTSSLPLISLINTKIHIRIKLKQFNDLTVHDDFVKVVIFEKTERQSEGKKSDNSIIKANLLMDYIYLDEDERNKFISFRHEYLIEQLQYLSPIYMNKSDILDGTISINLNFKNCVKDMYWICQTETNLNLHDYANGTSSVSTYNEVLNELKNIMLYKSNGPIMDIINTAYNRQKNKYGLMDLDINNINMSWISKTELDSINDILKNVPEYGVNSPITNNQIVLNGKTLLDRDSKYTTLVIPYQKYENNPYNGLNVYSFCLNPKERQPSGSLNFSMMKNNNVQLNVTLDKTLALSNDLLCIKVIARHYNILRIFSGLGACVYNN